MKRIIASLLALSFVFSFWTSAYAEDEKSEYSNAMLLMYDLGIVNGYEDGTLRPDNNITRMEFVTMALRLMGHYNADESYASKSTFEDVTADLWGAKNINLAYELKLVDGHTDTIFAPQDNVTVNQAAKVLICILGYKTIAEKEGYPNGYVSIGTDLSLFDDVGIGERPATRDDVARLMANALDANMMEAKYSADGTVDYVESDKTLLQEMGIEKRRGVVYAVPGIDIGTGRSLKDNQVIVNDTLYQTTKTGIYDEVGSELEIWVVVETDTFIPEIVHYEKRPTETELTVPSYSISPNTTTSQFVYANESNKRKTISIDSDTIVIYNGKLLTTGEITDDMLKPEMGYVVLKNIEDGDMPVIMVWEFENYVAQKVTEGGVIYDVFGSKLDLSEDGVKNIILDGQSISVENLKEGDILSVAAHPNGEDYKIYVSRETMDGTISQIRQNSASELIYTIDGTDYYVARSYQTYVERNSAKVKELYVGDSSTFYLDYFGNIAYTDAVNEEPDTKYGYIIEAAYDDIEDVLYVKLMNDSNAFERFTVSENSGTKCGVYKNGRYTVSKKNFDALRGAVITDYGVKMQLVKYKASADGTLQELYLLDTSGTSDVWGKSKGARTSMTYANGTLDGEYTIDANTIAFYIPNTGTETNLFKSGRAVTLISSSAYNLQLYDIIDNRVGVMLIRGEEAQTTGYKYIIDMTNDSVMLIEEVASHIVDDEEVTYIKGWQDGKQVSVDLASTLETNSEPASSLKPGMLIQYKTNSDDRSRAETSDELSKLIIYRTIVDNMSTPLAPYQKWNYANDWMSSAQIRMVSGTVKSYSLPNMIVDSGSGEYENAAMSIDDSVNVIRWNRENECGELATIYDIMPGDTVLVRTRYNVTKEVYIFE